MSIALSKMHQFRRHLGSDGCRYRSVRWLGVDRSGRGQREERAIKRGRRAGTTSTAAATMMILFCMMADMTGSAYAEVVARYPANQWVVEANASGGTFQNCAMSPAASRGAKVVLMLSRDGKWGIGVMNLTARQAPGLTSRLAYWVDDVIPRGGTATAVDETTMVAPLANTTQLFEELRLGSMMNVQVGGDTFHFSTNGISAALAAVNSCVRRHSQGAQK